MATSRKIFGCQGCRARHLKCDSNLPSCRRCDANGEACVREINIRFRYGPEAHKTPYPIFSKRQSWVDTTGSTRFHDESLEIASLYEGTSWFNAFARSGYDSDPMLSDPDLHPTDISERDHEEREPGHDRDPGRVAFPSYPPGHTERNTSEALATLEGVPVQTANGQYNEKNTLPTSIDKGFELTEREAILMRNYINNMALWADISDPVRHFELEVPRRALRQPVLLYAILAFSSRHLNRKSEAHDTEALVYYNRSLQLLIPVISAEPESITEDVLAAVAILRQYEEMEAYDNQFHLTGTTKLLESMSNIIWSGSLGEAAAWLCLRESIHISLVSQQPLKARLTTFQHSSAFTNDDDAAWANRMVFLLAKVLSYAFQDESHVDRATAIKQVSEEVDHWNSNKPETFAPIYTMKQSHDSGHKFPVMWMLSPFHVVGLQYYHMARIVIEISSHSTLPVGYATLRRGRQVEKLVRHHLLTILGLSSSNEKVENGLFTARHALAVWGGILQDKQDQEAALRLLERIEERTGWSVLQLVNSLKEQWDEGGG